MLIGFHHWSRDLIFLFPRDPQALETWLYEYHFNASHQRSTGALQIGLVLHITGASCLNFERMELLVEGANGLLPNLDLVNVVARLARTKGLSVSVGESPLRIPLLSGFRFFPRRLHERFEPLVRMILRQASSGAASLWGPLPLHSAFLGYRVDAVTLRGRAKRGLDSSMRGVFETVEGTMRSMNNLLEHLHQSFFFYLLPGRESFVSIANYIALPTIFGLSHLLSFFAHRQLDQQSFIGTEDFTLVGVTSLLVVVLAKLIRGRRLSLTLLIVDIVSRCTLYNRVSGTAARGEKRSRSSLCAVGHLLSAVGILLLSLSNASLAILLGSSAFVTAGLSSDRCLLAKRSLLWLLFNPVLWQCLRADRPEDLWNFGIPLALLYPGNLLMSIA